MYFLALIVLLKTLILKHAQQSLIRFSLSKLFITNQKLFCLKTHIRIIVYNKPTLKLLYNGSF